ncbi:MAG: cobalt ECF transporter T component CbiQ [Desulfopila sp.]|jgi:cobalt/nickel transport system permease protein|nr:cobalt ECF transporter T component CbiQ [Desulfopila sp.]
MTPHNEIHISITALATVLGAAIFSIVLLRMALRQKQRRNAAGRNGDPDWSVPTIDAYADRISFFHQWDPRVKIATLFPYCFIVVSLQSLLSSTIALLVSLGAVAACRIPFARTAKRLLAMAGFLSMFLLVVPFTSPLRGGETLIYFPGMTHFPFHMAGFFVALNIVIKACGVALLMEPLFGTAPLAVTLQSLSRLGLPDSISQMILLSHRYIFVFLNEIQRMYRGMRVRGFMPGTNIATMNAMGNFFGMLFVRSFDRTQRVYEAMLCRGYNGRFPSFIRFQATPKDWGKTVFWLLLGLLLLAIDRI